MSCSKCKNKPCGCEDHGLTTPPVCAQDTFDCPAPEPCSETFSDCCVIHINDTIVDINLQKGDRLCDILQRLTLLITNPGCILPGSTCLSVLGLQSTTITTTTIAIAWQPSTTAINYLVEYKLSSAVTWTALPAIVPVANPTAVIGGLTPGETYDIRVASICAAGSCYSVTIQTQTVLI